MKQQVSPAMLAVALVIALAVLGGLYYKFLGPGSVSPQSAVASPYGMPKPGEGFKTPPPGGSGINTITGEPLPPTARNRTSHAGMPGPPPGTVPPTSAPQAPASGR